MLLPSPGILLLLQKPYDAEALRQIRTPVPFSAGDAGIRASRERVVREAQRSPKAVFERQLARAERTLDTRDIVLAIAAGVETVPRYVKSTCHDYTRLLHLVQRKGKPENSLEYRRAFYLARMSESLSGPNESIKTDSDGRIRRALFQAYPDDPQVWHSAAGDALYVTRFVGDADAQRVAAWWARWSPAKDPRFTDRYSLGAQMETWLGIAAYTKAPADARKAEGFYRAWAKLIPPSQGDDVKFFGKGVDGVKRLAGIG